MQFALGDLTFKVDMSRCKYSSALVKAPAEQVSHDIWNKISIHPTMLFRLDQAVFRYFCLVAN